MHKTSHFLQVLQPLILQETNIMIANTHGKFRFKRN